MIKQIRTWWLLVLLVGYTGFASANDLIVQNAWARFSVAGMTASGVFMDIINQGKQDDTLIDVKTSVADTSEIHESLNQNGMMHMQALPDGLVLPAHQTVHLQPGHVHIMLMDLKQPLKQGSSIPLKLIFKHHQPVDINVPVTVGHTTNHTHDHTNHDTLSNQATQN